VSQPVTLRHKVSQSVTSVTLGERADHVKDQRAIYRSAGLQNDIRTRYALIKRGKYCSYGLL